MSALSLDRVAPPIFVLIWSTGWIAAGYAARTSNPLTFLSLFASFSRAPRWRFSR